jgi:hypothetical protein
VGRVRDASLHHRPQRRRAPRPALGQDLDAQEEVGQERRFHGAAGRTAEDQEVGVGIIIFVVAIVVVVIIAIVVVVVISPSSHPSMMNGGDYVRSHNGGCQLGKFLLASRAPLRAEVGHSSRRILLFLLRLRLLLLLLLLRLLRGSGDDGNEGGVAVKQEDDERQIFRKREEIRVQVHEKNSFCKKDILHVK